MSSRIKEGENMPEIFEFHFRVPFSPSAVPSYGHFSQSVAFFFFFFFFGLDMGGRGGNTPVTTPLKGKIGPRNYDFFQPSPPPPTNT